MTGRHPSQRPPGRPGDRAAPAGEGLIAAERAGVPTHELITRASAHLEAVYHAHPHLRPVPDPPPDEGSDAWYGYEPDPMPAYHRRFETARAERAITEAAQREAPTVWAELCELLDVVTTLHATVHDHAAQLASLWQLQESRGSDHNEGGAA